MTKTGDLRKDKPDPMTGLSPGPQLSNDCVIHAFLGVEEAVEIVNGSHEMCLPSQHQNSECPYCVLPILFLLASFGLFKVFEILFRFGDFLLLAHFEVLQVLKIFLEIRDCGRRFSFSHGGIMCINHC